MLLCDVEHLHIDWNTVLEMDMSGVHRAGYAVTPCYHHSKVRRLGGDFWLVKGPLLHTSTLQMFLESGSGKLQV